MKIMAIIPARYASTRFPGKPLAIIGGKPMVQRVYEQALQCRQLTAVVVATDDERIRQAVLAFGGEVVMTRDDHPSGTDRIAEVAAQFPEVDIVVNIQGDEPFVQVDQLDQLCAFFADPSVAIATLAHPLVTAASIADPNIVKAVFSGTGRALYFSRSPVPYLRGVPVAEWAGQEQHFQHLGLYAYRRDVLLAITQLPPSPLERAESLEQLRWLEAGYPIYIGVTPTKSLGIDTPEDLQQAEAWWNAQQAI
ncbi:MAG: 3-deoxy-manno-octulosonate cytidylyltransferase [Bacteroidetes bacterium]|nr:MAG: 3-deoxy-manno-octulosonate cytidylyltransferase [Bacteroidota bacterium]